MSVTLVNDDNFDSKVISSNQPVLVDFFANWCGPCKQLTPTVEKFALNNTDIFVTKVDVDESPDIAGQFGLRGVPTLMLFHHGEKIAAHTGAMSPTRLEQWVREHIDAPVQTG